MKEDRGVYGENLRGRPAGGGKLLKRKDPPTLASLHALARGRRKFEKRRETHRKDLGREGVK